LSAFGVFVGADFFRVQISANNFRDIACTAGGVSSLAACIGSNSVIVGSWTGIEVTGNSFVGTTTDSEDTLAIYAYAKNVAQVAIAGNTCGGYSRGFFDVLSTSGGLFEEVSVTGNTINDTSMSAIYLQAGGATCRGIVLANNSIKSANGPLISVHSITTGSIVISGNSLYLDDTNNVIICTSTVMAKIIGNYIYCQSGVAGQEALVMSTGCDHYTIMDNTIEGPTVPGTSIITTAASTTKGYVTNNFLSATTTLHTNDVYGYGNQTY